MANNKHVLTIETEIKDAHKKLKQLEEQLDGLAEKAGKGIKVNGGINGNGSGGGGFGGIAELVGMVGRFAGPQGIAVAAAAATKKFADHIAGLSSELREASEMSGVGIEELQRLTGVMKNVNLTASQAADVHKDVNEKIYEAVQSGTGEVAGVAEEYKLKFEEISKVMENGGNGIDALAKMYYMLRQQGHTANEAASAISRVSDKGGELAHQFEKMGSEAEYYKQKGQQTITITEEMAKKHAEYEQKTKDLSTAIDGIKVEVFQDLIVGMTDFFNHLYRSLIQYKSDAALTSNFKAPKLTGAAKEQQEKLQQQFHRNSTHKSGLGGDTGNWMGKEQGLSYQEALMLVKMNMDPTKYFKHANNQMYRALQMAREGKNFNNSDARNNFRFTFDGKVYDGNYNQIEIAKVPQKPGRGLNDGGGTTCSKCGGKKHEGNEKCPVDLAKEAQQRREKEQKQREDALKKLNDLDVKLQGQTAASIASQNKQLEASLKDLDTAVDMGLISQQDAAEKRQQLIDQNASNVYKMVLGADPIDALNALTQLQQIRDNELASHKRLLDNKAISYEEYMRRVNDTEQSYSQIEDSLGGMAGYKTNQLHDEFDGDLHSNSPFAAFYDVDKDKAKAEQDYQTEKNRINELKDPIQRNAEMERLNEIHQKKMRDIDKKYADARLGVAADMYEGFSGLMSIFGAENSKAMQAAFQAYQAYQIGEATVAMYGAAQDAWAETKGGTGAKMAAAALAVGQGMANIAKIKATSISGMAHDGIDNIPREGTWLLDKGERVVDQRTNGDLKDFLANQKSGGGNSQPIEVHAPLTIQGNVNSSDAMVMEAIKRHPKLVAQAVEDAQRRRM